MLKNRRIYKDDDEGNNREPASIATTVQIQYTQRSPTSFFHLGIWYTAEYTDRVDKKLFLGKITCNPRPIHSYCNSKVL